MSAFKRLYNKIEWRLAKGEKVCEILRKRGMKIGKNCELYKDVLYPGEPYLCSFGDNVRVTSGVKFITHDGGVWVCRNNGQLTDADVFGKIIVGNNVHIGVNAIIMPGVTIGNNVVIGCGAVVTRDIPDNSIAVGVPAKVIESYDEYLEKLSSKCDYTKHMSYEEKKKYLIDKFSIE